MHSKIAFSSVTIALMFFLACGPEAHAQAKQEVTTELSSTQYLFFLNENYRLSARVPTEDAATATETQLQVKSVSVDLKAAPTGVRDIPETKVEFQGVTYIVPAHKIVVLEEQPKENGFYIHTAPDPNGSGNVELLVGWNADKRPEENIWLDYNNRPKDIEVVSSSSSSSSSDKYYRWSMTLVLRNKTGAPYTLKPDFFKNLPPLEEWPEVVIPPVDAKH